MSHKMKKVWNGVAWHSSTSSKWSKKEMVNKQTPCKTAVPDLIATEMLVFPSKSARNQNDSNLTIAIP